MIADGLHGTEAPCGQHSPWQEEAAGGFFNREETCLASEGSLALLGANVSRD